jgi:hypothetical protein
MGKALTGIKHGKGSGDDHELYEVAAGESVDKGKFTKDEWEALVAAGAIQEDEDAPEPPGTFLSTADNQNYANGDPLSTDDAETHQAKLDAKAKAAEEAAAEQAAAAGSDDQGDDSQNGGEAEPQP